MNFRIVERVWREKEKKRLKKAYLPKMFFSSLFLAIVLLECNVLATMCGTSKKGSWSSLLLHHNLINRQTFLAWRAPRTIMNRSTLLAIFLNASAENFHGTFILTYDVFVFCFCFCVLLLLTLSFDFFLFLLVFCLFVFDLVL